jgi:riboflavin biosynthesis pyrimidine reductase
MRAILPYVLGLDVAATVAWQDGAMQLIFDRDGRPLGPIENGDLVELYRQPAPSDRAWLRTNFVMTLDGSAQGPDGRSGSINTPSDHRIFALHRTLADAVLVGASTVRNEGYRAIDLQPWQLELRQNEGLAPHPMLVIISASAAIDPSIAQPIEGEGGPVMIITTPGKPADELDPLRAAGIRVIETQGPTVDLAQVVDQLAGGGWPRLLCEGGPHLHNGLIAAGLVDELSLTVAPMVVGGEGLRPTSGTGLSTPSHFALQHAIYAEDGALFTNYRHVR